MRFKDRMEAGRRLAEALAPLAHRRDVVVLALPRGGVPVGHEVARTLAAPLDVFLVRKLGVPGHPELAMGAIASGGVRVLSEDLIDQLGIPRSAVELPLGERRDPRPCAETARRHARLRRVVRAIGDARLVLIGEVRERFGADAVLVGRVLAPTLLVLGERDETVLELNRRAMEQMRGEVRLEIVPRATHRFEEASALERVAQLAADWFAPHLTRRKK
jgi:hypothetical protein